MSEPNYTMSEQLQTLYKAIQPKNNRVQTLFERLYFLSEADYLKVEAIYFLALIYLPIENLLLSRVSGNKKVARRATSGRME